MGLIIPRSSVRSWHLALSAAPAKRATRGGDRTHNLRLRKPTRFHCATRALVGKRSRGHAGARTQDLRLIRATLYRLSYTTIISGMVVGRVAQWKSVGPRIQRLQVRVLPRSLCCTWLLSSVAEHRSRKPGVESSILSVAFFSQDAAHGYLAQWQSIGPVNQGSGVRSSQWPVWWAAAAASLAQSVERKALNLVVAGSSPAGGGSFPAHPPWRSR